ncbi:unnamed protein product [Moneuplotes crassus]|uniref:Uncharacterized protein n=1 Tax=Euplotes crassus TaxID=5936 RepID=A0AAD2DAU1_EUPCR|nr:unnamed protein product [Moneuplotes crassus]
MNFEQEDHPLNIFAIYGQNNPHLSQEAWHLEKDPEEFTGLSCNEKSLDVKDETILVNNEIHDYAYTGLEDRKEDRDEINQSLTLLSTQEADLIFHILLDNPHNSQFEPVCAKSKTNSEMDLSKKTFIRMLRRFYSKLFKEENTLLQRKRFKNVDFKIQLQACKDFNFKYFDDASDNFAFYMLRLLDMKARRKPSPHLQSEFDAMTLVHTTRSFSRERFSHFHECEYFRKIFIYLYKGTLPNSEKLCMEVLKNNESKTMAKDQRSFLNLFEQMYQRCIVS